MRPAVRSAVQRMRSHIGHGLGEEVLYVDEEGLHLKAKATLVQHPRVPLVLTLRQLELGRGGDKRNGPWLPSGAA